jgi:hypothetical protein
MAHIKLSASPRFPDDDSTNTVSFGLAIPRRSKSSTSPIAVLTLIEPVILNPSNFRNTSCLPAKSLEQKTFFTRGRRSGAAHQFHHRHLRGDLEAGTLNICRLWCSLPVHRPFGDALSIMHSACQIGNARIGHRSRHGQPGLVGGKLMYGPSAFWMKLFERADPAGNTGPAQSIVSYSPVPRLVRRSRVL